MLKMIKGVKIHCANKLNEEYMIDGNSIIANINADKISKIINDFVDIQKEPLFLILEIPTNKKNENIKDDIINQTHKDVYYLDNMSISYVKEILNKFGKLFINDGIAQIGVGNHITNAEIMTSKYNVITLFSGKDKLEKYKELLEHNNIKQVDKLVTAWDFFTKENPGECNSIDEDGKSTYDYIDILTKEDGLYFAERRED
ncbi:MAG: hypothetical protein E7174_02235 [Firmicutes bacterium]|nr:hypothetical protein [Bacillota bacterium]